MLSDEEKQSKSIAHSVLKRYRYYKHKARQFPSLGSPVSDGMPKAPSVENGQEHKNINYIDDPAKKYCEYCEKLVHLITTEESSEHGKLLILKYFKLGYSPAKIYVELCISRTKYYDMIDEALVAFGESVNRQYVAMLEDETKIES